MTSGRWYVHSFLFVSCPRRAEPVASFDSCLRCTADWSLERLRRSDAARRRSATRSRTFGTPCARSTLPCRWRHPTKRCALPLLCCQGNLVDNSARVSVCVCHQVEEQLKKIKEYSLVEDPEDRKGAWEKFVKRQKVRSPLPHFQYDLYLTFIAVPFRKSYGRRSERHLPAITPGTRRTPTETESSQTVGVGSLTLINQPNRGRRTRRTIQT